MGGDRNEIYGGLDPNGCENESTGTQSESQPIMRESDSDWKTG